MPKISVLICCANAADTLADACRSVAWADEIVVIDSGSEDATPEIAQEFAHKYMVEPWRGYRDQKVFGIDQVSHDWVLILDGDEEVSEPLAQELRAMSDARYDQLDVITFPRHNYVLGRHVRAWGPDWQARLIHRERALWPEEVLHDTCLPTSPERGIQTRGWINHKRTSSVGFSDYFSGRRMDERLMLVAEQMHARGKKAGVLDLLLRPPLAFVKFYVFKLGFLDGVFGLMVAQKAWVSVQLKYAALWALERGQGGESTRKSSS